MINLLGGDEQFGTKLYRSFTNNQFTFYYKPDIAYPYLFTRVKVEEHRTEELLKKIMSEIFEIDHNGLPGNYNCGAISTWFIFSGMGFYTYCAVLDYYTWG
jgi:putative alpha-1,2-mannosidase